MRFIPQAVKRFVARQVATSFSVGFENTTWQSIMQQMGLPTFSGITVNAEQAMRTSAVYACVNLISRSIAVCPINLMERTGVKSSRVAAGHPVQNLLYGQPNPRINSHTWKRMMIAHEALRGNAFSYVERDDYGVPMALIPVHPMNVQVLRNLDDGMADYKVNLAGNNGFQAVSRENLLHFKVYTDDGIHGLGPLQLARDQIGSARAADEYSGRFFANDATPSGYLSYPAEVNLAQGRTPAEAKTMKEMIRDSYMEMVTGENRHKPPVFDRGLKWEKIGISPQDAQMLETRKYNVSDIARIFGVPPHLIGDVDRSTSWGTGIEQMGIGFIVFTLLDWTVGFEEELERLLLREDEREGYFIKINLNALQRGDFKSRMESYDAGIKGSILTPNESRALEDLPPLQGGDLLYRQQTLVPLTTPVNPSASNKITVGTEGK